MKETQGGLSFQIRIPNIPHKECSIRAEPEADRKIKCFRLPCQVYSTTPLVFWIICTVCEGRRRRRWRGLWLVLVRCRFHPRFNMWFSSEKAEWRSSRFTELIGIQCNINITHPLILSCFVCLACLVPREPVLFWPFCHCSAGLKSGELYDQSWQSFKHFAVRWGFIKTREFFSFHKLKTVTCQHYSAVFVFKRSF